MGFDSRNSDVIILGAGMIGLTQALTLAAHGLRVAIIDRVEPANLPNPQNDGRVSAINSASWNMFDAIGLAEKLRPHGCDIGKILVNDGLKPGTLDFVPGDDEGPMGIMVENAVLHHLLFQAVQTHANIALHLPAQVISCDRAEHRVDITLDNGKQLSAPLLVAADGRGSRMREEAGIIMAHWQYDHSAIVCKVAHEKPHGNTAYELFFPAGPFAILPMLDDEDGKHRSALVWTVSRKDGPVYAKISKRAFVAEMMKKTGGFLGEMELLTDRQTYPLGFHHCSHLTADRLALIGDAGHGIHPIAGQGLNLGLRDVAALTECLVEGARTGLDLGDLQSLARYDRWRSLDNMMVSASTDLLTRLFGLPGKTSSAIRRMGIGLVQRIPPLKAQFMAEAKGETGDLPKLLRGELV
jgi:2-octaprenyl-6-methoxyphenol hydroxylase